MRTALNNLRAFFSALGFEGVPEIATAELPAFSLSAHTSALPDAFAPAPLAGRGLRVRFLLLASTGAKAEADVSAAEADADKSAASLVLCSSSVKFSVVSVTLSTSAADGHDAGACSPKSGVAATATATESAAATWAATGSSAACNLGEDFADLLPDLRFFACLPTSSSAPHAVAAAAACSSSVFALFAASLSLASASAARVDSFFFSSMSS
mmetsp:Transcript_78162/g.114438  ORF Transcript_78162/g.114438 Transcript_78162/m.114438 type:complete len:212 (+) Transcript_78162:96-731(+)